MARIEKIKVEGKKEKNVLKQAYKVFSQMVDDDFKEEDITLDLLEEKKGFLGLIGKNKVYQCTLEIKDKIVNEDGEFKVSVRDKGIFLLVKQPKGKGREIKMDMIEEVLDNKEIVEVDYEALSEGLTLDGEEVKIAQRKYELDRDAKIEVSVSKDKMEAYLDYTPPLGGKTLELEEVIEKIKESGVVFGLRKEELVEVFDPEEPLESFLIAKGEEPTPGEDGRVKFNFDLDSHERKVNLLEDGSADFRNLDRIVNVKPDDLLATKILPKEGESGNNVLGEDIEPKPVKEVDIPVGENVNLSEDGMTLKAAMEGQAVYNKSKISVLDVYTVNGDVNLSTGNVDFSGSVIVNGNITDGMEVKANGNILIKGSVYGACLEAEGQIVIEKGLIGSNKGKVSSKGDVEVKFIENATVDTDGDLVVKDAIMHSTVNAGGKVVVISGKGLIVGGEVRAAQEIDAKIIGSNLATPTEISVGVTPELRDSFREVDIQFKDKQDKLDQAIKNIRMLKKKREEQDGRLSEKRQQLLNQLIRQRFSIVKEIEELKQERNELADRLEEGKNGNIKVKDTLYSGAILTIGTSIHRVSEDASYVQYYLKDENVKSKPYS
ncbi:FapA family protein [Halonatronum saccharophilum]|uniref:FapA family protein n=1 Tax=Halonatronum saccharophilum TaxID=150060 RepID=UPI00048497C1|nr:FapA family protein [Halonatronum saccharophilum]